MRIDNKIFLPSTEDRNHITPALVQKFFSVFLAPTGRVILAQGATLGTGRPIPPPGSERAPHETPLQGEKLTGWIIPRVAPWASMRCPFRANILCKINAPMYYS